jgi:hypothetical protein
MIRKFVGFISTKIIELRVSILLYQHHHQRIIVEFMHPPPFYLRI